MTKIDPIIAVKDVEPGSIWYRSVFGCRSMHLGKGFDIRVTVKDGVFDQKIYPMSAHESQFFDWLPWTSENMDKVPKDEKRRLEFLAKCRTFSPNKTTGKTLKKMIWRQSNSCQTC